MTSPLSSFVEITFRATPDTPPAALPLDGRTFLLAPEYLSSIGSGPTNPGVIKGVRGYLVEVSPGVREWMMTSEFPAAVGAQIDAIPGGLGWVDQAARTVYVDRGRALRRDHGVPVPEIVALFDALYDAAATNRNAQIAAGG